MTRRKRSPEENERRAKIRELLLSSNISSMEDIQDLFKETIAEFMESGLEAELDDELGYGRYDYRNKDTDNSRNGHSSKTLRTSYGDVEVAVPRDRKGEFEPQILKKNQTSVSEAGAGIELLNTLYRQTKDILNLVRRTSATDEVDVWQKQHFPQQHPALPLFYTDQAQLYSLIRSGEKEAAQALLGRIRKLLNPSSLPEERIAQQVYADLHSLVTRLRFECGDAAAVPELPLLQDESDSSVLFSDLQRCIAALCDLFAARREPFPVAVCRFMDEHLSDSALSAVMVADHFSISTPTLQKVIRQQKACSFYDYVAQKRYEMSVELLTQTDVPISAIAAQCGFGSVNSFYKAFKRMSSISPSNVRMNARSGAQPL